MSILHLLLGTAGLHAQTTNPYPMRNIVLMLPATYTGEGFEAAHFDPRVRDGTLYLWPRADTGGGTNTINGITNLNGQTVLVQTFATGTAGTDFAIASAAGVHTWNLPTASAANRGALSTADWTTFNNKQASITWQTQGVTLATAPTTVNWTTGVTGYVSGATALLGVNAAGGSTNALVQTNGVNVGSIGTVNFIGATGAVISGVATIGGFGGSSTTTNFVTTAHGTATITNGLYMGAAGSGSQIYSYDNVSGAYRLVWQSGTATLTYGTNEHTHEFRGSTVRPANGFGVEFGSSFQAWSNAWFRRLLTLDGNLSVSTNGNLGFLTVTNWQDWRDGANAFTRWADTNASPDTNVNWYSVFNPSAGQVMKFHSVTWDANGVAHVVITNATDNTGGAGSSVFNINQFSASATHTNIKDGALFTNAVNYAMTNLGAFSNSGPAFLGGFLDAKGPNTNRVQLNLPHLTASRSAVINAQGDVTNSSAASNWSLYDTNLLFGAAGNSGAVQFNEGGILAGTNRLVYDRTNNMLYLSNQNFGASISVRSPNLGYTNNIYADGLSVPRNSFNIFLNETTHATDTTYYQFATNSLFYNASNNTSLGKWNVPWNTNFANRVQAKEGVSWGNDDQAYYTLEATNAVKTTNIFRFSMTNIAAGNVWKVHNVQNLSGGQVIVVMTNDVDNSGGAGAGILTNANQFGAAAATVTIKESALLTNTIFYSSDTNRTNVAIQQTIGQAVPMLSIRDSNSAPVVEFDNRGFLILTNSLTNYNLGNTRGTPANTIAVGVEDFGGFIVPAWFKDSKLNWAINPARWNSRTYTLFPSAGTTVGADGVTTANAGGTTVAHTTPDEKLPYMISVSSAATSNSVGAVSMTVNVANAGAHNGSSKAAGYFFHTEWCNTNIIAQVVGGGAPRFFIGLANAATPNLTNIVNTTNATGQYIGLMADPKESLNMYITARDGSAEFRTNTGINFKATNMFQISIYNSPTNRFVGWKLKDLTDRLEATGVFSNNVPTNFMKGTIMVKNGTNRNCEIRLSKMYLQAPLTPQ